MSTGIDAGRLHGAGLTDVRMMAVAHTSFRRELKLAAPAVRNVASGDRRRARQVADHVDLWLGLVHHHHTIEDELLWDKLVVRVGDELAPLVQLMEEQHHTVAAMLDESPTLVQAWRASAYPADRERLAVHLVELSTALCEHLDAEEGRVLPLMAQHITPEEWDEFTERGMEAIPKGMLLVGFGMMLYEGDPDALALEIVKLPAPLRPILPVLARRAFRRYARRIHGTAAPERGLAPGCEPVG
jgi:hemerythrin-like domain-containing protein